MLWDATADDVPMMAGVIGDWCRETPWMPKLHSRAEDLLFVGGLVQSHTVRMTEGLGFLARQGAVVDALYLAPQGRGRGLGRALLAEVKVLSLVQLWTFQANTRARAFYLREGFCEVRFTDGSGNDEKLPDVWMEWRG
jgi:ribosomal protein S18 acetylase RimI-like enzyme